MAENFFSTLKLELVPDKAFASREAARLAVLDYIKTFYNRTRMMLGQCHEVSVKSHPNLTKNPALTRTLGRTIQKLAS